MAAGYLIVMGAIAAGLRARRAEHPRPGRGWRALAVQAAGTAIGGYLLLMVIVVVYYYAIAHVRGSFIRSAITGNALLLGLAAPLFAAISLLAEWLHRRRTPPGDGTHPADGTPPGP